MTDDEKYQKAITEVKEFLEANPALYQVTKDGKYWKFKEDSQEWVPNSAESLRASDYRVRPQLNWEIFLTAMQAGERIKDTKTYSFKPVPNSVLNMMRDQDWLKPSDKRTENSIMFDCLMRSVSGSNPDNARHLKQVIGWKYDHPETWQLPAIAFYGCGSAGKNLLFEIITAQIFGQGAVCRRAFEQVKRFNESIAGKTIVFFDERPSRDDESTLKFFVGQSNLTIEPKGSAVYEVENTALYVIATNGDNGPVRIENNGTERRWSIIKTREAFHDVVMEEMGLKTEEEARDIIKAADAEVFRNPEEVAYFLHTCLLESRKLDTAPRALHGEDFDELVEIQRDATDDLLTDVFIDYSNFEWIGLNTLYELYKNRTQEANPSAHCMSQQTFSGKVNSFLMNHKLKHIKKTEGRKIIKTSTGTYNSKTTVFFNSDKAAEQSWYTDNAKIFESNFFLMEKIEKSVAIKGIVANNIIKM
jgi:hypothetical protein